MKKALCWILGILAAVCLAIGCIWGGEIATIRSISPVAGNKYLYRMEYKAAYDLDDVIAQDIDENAELLDYVVGRIGKGLPIKMKSAQVADENGEMATLNCTSFQARKADGEGFYFGRNYDFFKNPTMVTVTHPRKGYASIAVSDMSHFGYSLEKIPTSTMAKLSCLAAIYAPVDGINEKGLCTSVMALPKQASQQDTPKHDVGTTIIMRLWLDRCATVDEALALLETVDVRHDAAVGSGYHYMVADAAGDCAVVEFAPSRIRPSAIPTARAGGAMRPPAPISRNTGAPSPWNKPRNAWLWSTGRTSSGTTGPSRTRSTAMSMTSRPSRWPSATGAITGRRTGSACSRRKKVFAT